MVKSAHSSALTINSQTYAPTDCNKPIYYYEAIQVNVAHVGYYMFNSESTIATDGYIYKDTFFPYSPTTNVLSMSYSSCDKNQLELGTILHINTTYILVVTTHDPNMTGNFSVFASGPNNVSFNRISEYPYYSLNN